MKQLSAVLITHNEESKIEVALRSLAGITDEIVVVDSESTDSTRARCRLYTDLVLVREWTGYREQKQFATQQASYDWVISLDADEALSSGLREELADWKKRDDDGFGGYLVPRLTFFMGRWIRHTLWYPDMQLRLFRKSRGDWEGGRVHESFKVRGSVGHMGKPILHYTYSSSSEFLSQLRRFSCLAALDYQDQERRAKVVHLTLNPVLVFLKSYILCRGFRDGLPGLVVSVYAGISYFSKYLRLWEMQHPAKAAWSDVSGEEK